MGILCSIKELNVTNGKVSFAEDCIEVPVYEFNSDNILRLENGLSFYRNAFAGLPNKLYQLKSPLDIVKNIVFSSISWATYKTRGYTRAEYRSFKDFLGAIPVENIVQRIEAECRCSDSVAKELLNEFLSIVWKYVDGDSLEDDVILSAISASSELQERTKALIRADWEAENKGLLADAQKELDVLNAKLESVNTSLTEAQEAFNKTKLEEERLSSVIAEKEKLAEDVEAAVADRIEMARKNAAGFIANMAFVDRHPNEAAAKQTPKAVETLAQPVASQYHAYSAAKELDDLEVHHSWNEVINTASFELGEAGVADRYRNGLAAFLCAAYIERQPILLVGPNSIDISKALCAAIAGHKHGMLSCEGSYSSHVLQELGHDGEDIVIINNLFASGWMNRLPEILSNKDIFYIATHPYAEDIQVEPKSLYGFILPLFTEFFVDNKASGKYYGGYFADDFKPYAAQPASSKELRILPRLSLSTLVKNRINSVISTMHGIHSSTTADEEFIFAILPIAYATLELNDLTEMIADPQKGIELSASLKRDLRFILGEL